MIALRHRLAHDVFQEAVTLKVPEGYEEQVSDSKLETQDSSDGDSAGDNDSASDPNMFGKAPGYERVKKPPMLRGKEYLCHNCYDKGLGFQDTVCPACLESLRQLTRIRMQIGQTYPKALELSLPKLMVSLFKALVKERKRG